jgi:hypothetical protein
MQRRRSAPERAAGTTALYLRAQYFSPAKQTNSPLASSLTLNYSKNNLKQETNINEN